MHALSRWLDRFCYRHPKFGIPNLMMYIAVGNAIVFLLDLVSRNTFSAILSFVPALIFRGQIWRLVSFIFVPADTNPIVFILSVLLYYFLGTQLERAWGSAKFTIYYLVGILLNVIMGLILGLATSLGTLPIVNMYYVNMSLFFAFATLYPDAQFVLYFIIPVKAKWLAWLDAGLFLINIIMYLSQGAYLLALVPVVAILNYLLFFWEDLTSALFRKRRRARRSARPINLKQARQKEKEQGYLHKCAVCGLTDAQAPTMEFRYCSRCNGYYCYCADHINSHVHIQ